MRRERAVELVELLAAGGGDGDGHAQGLSAFALAQLNRTGIKCGVELVRNQGDRVHQSVHFKAHDLDRKQRRVFNQRLGARLVGRGHWCRSDQADGFKPWHWPHWVAQPSWTVQWLVDKPRTVSCRSVRVGLNPLVSRPTWSPATPPGWRR